MIINKFINIEDILSFTEIFKEKYPHKTNSQLSSQLKILCRDYKYSLYVLLENNDPVAIAGVTPGYLLYCGKYFQISNLFVKENHRNKGFASMLLQKIEIDAREAGCQSVVLDSYIDNQISQKTYFKENYKIIANHFVKNI